MPDIVQAIRHKAGPKINRPTSLRTYLPFCLGRPRAIGLPGHVADHSLEFVEHIRRHCAALHGDLAAGGGRRGLTEDSCVHLAEGEYALRIESALFDEGERTTPACKS